MLTKSDNELLTRTGPGTAMGNLMRRYRIPALLPAEVQSPDCAIARHLDAGVHNPEQALVAYERERQPRASRVQFLARQQYLNNKMIPSSPPISRDWIFIHDATTGRD